MTQVAQNDATGALTFGVAIPAAVEMIWSSIADLDLHLTGNDPVNGGRFHVNYANVGAYSTAPFALLDEDQTGVGGSEVIGISQFTPGAPYRASVFNFGDSAAGSTSLSSSANLRMRYITNGQISRGPSGSVIVNGTVGATVSAATGQAGNTFVGFEIDPATRAATVINRFVDSVDSGSVQ